MRRFLTFFALPLLWVTFLFAYPSHSRAGELSESDLTHAQNAFLFIERGRWDDALAHAKRAGNPLIYKLVHWRYVLSRDPGADASFEEITQFIDQNPDWPEQKSLATRAEEALVNSPASDEELTRWFEYHAPVTGYGKIRYAEALMRTSKSAAGAAAAASPANTATLIREGWVEGNFDNDTENRLADQYRSLLTREDHIARAARLLWEERTEAAQRMLPLVTDAYRSVVAARTALIKKERTAATLVDKVPTSLRNDPGLMFNRLLWNAERKRDGSVREILLAAPQTVPFPKKWWKYREKYIREAIADGNFRLAERLLKNHGQREAVEYAEALWLSGWLKLVHSKDAGNAYKDFYALFNAVKFPVSKARAAYWAGRAAEKKGNKDIAKGWYEQAVAYPTTFYGQLAAARIYDSGPLRLPAQPNITAADKSTFKRKELPRAIALLDQLGQKELMHQFVLQLVDKADSPKEAALAADFGEAIGHVEDGVKAAKRALQKNGIVLLDSGFPLPTTPQSLPIERALTLAIARQESEFDASAVSPSNALGLMQLLPSTAKEIAKKIDKPFSRAKLFEPRYNMELGSAYLGRLVDGFSGSYVMAIASYNAGPGRVRQWIAQFGAAEGSVEEIVNWIERIPYEETRNYVQRVLENLQVYRHLLAGKATPHLQIEDDLMR